MIKFVKAVTDNDYNLPKSVKNLADKDKKALKEFCFELN